MKPKTPPKHRKKALNFPLSLGIIRVLLLASCCFLMTLSTQIQCIFLSISTRSMTSENRRLWDPIFISLLLLYMPCLVVDFNPTQCFRSLFVFFLWFGFKAFDFEIRSYDKSSFSVGNSKFHALVLWFRVSAEDSKRICICECLSCFNFLVFIEISVFVTNLIHFRPQHAHGSETFSSKITWTVMGCAC